MTNKTFFYQIKIHFAVAVGDFAVALTSVEDVRLDGLSRDNKLDNLITHHSAEHFLWFLFATCFCEIAFQLSSEI